VDQDLEKTRALEKAKFKAADADGDDLLNLQEMASLFYLETSPAVLDVVVRDTLKLKDKNKDGVLNVKEFWDFGPENAGEKIKEEEMRVFRQLDKEIWISPRFTAGNHG
jgi:Ca2+-binding EF-hand superfamily protein